MTFRHRAPKFGEKQIAPNLGRIRLSLDIVTTINLYIAIMYFYYHFKITMQGNLQTNFSNERQIQLE